MFLPCDVIIFFNSSHRTCGKPRAIYESRYAMIIISQGLGFLVLVFAVLWVMLDQAVQVKFPGDRWLRTVGLLVVCGVIAAIGLVMNRKQPNQYGNQGSAHSLYWVPMEYWSIIMLALGAMGVWGLR